MLFLKVIVLLLFALNTKCLGNILYLLKLFYNFLSEIFNFLEYSELLIVILSQEEEYNAGQAEALESNIINQAKIDRKAKTNTFSKIVINLKLFQLIN